jgi:hypothetical protein
LLICHFAVACSWLDETRLGGSDPEHRRLGFRVFAQFTHLVVRTDFGLFLFAPVPALGFVALLLLPRLLFLALGKCGSSSRHSEALLSLVIAVRRNAVFDQRTQGAEELPSRLSRLACVTAIIVPSASSATKAPSAAVVGSLSLWPCLVDGQCAATEFGAIESCDGLLSFSGIGHFDERKATRTSGIAVGHHSDPLHVTMRLK